MVLYGRKPSREYRGKQRQKSKESVFLEVSAINQAHMKVFKCLVVLD